MSQSQDKDIKCQDTVQEKIKDMHREENNTFDLLLQTGLKTPLNYLSLKQSNDIMPRYCNCKRSPGSK